MPGISRATAVRPDAQLDDTEGDESQDADQHMDLERIGYPYVNVADGLFHRENMCSQFAAHTAARNKTQIKKSKRDPFELAPSGEPP